MKTHQLAPGTVLGRYELLLPVASGGMATVWVARARGSRGFSKTVAVKTILPSLSDDPQFEQMFLDEAAIASRIQHPNVAQIIDLGEEDEILYLAMEWVDGESLSTLSKFARKNGTDIPLRVGLRVLTQACAGIHAAHELRDDDDRLLELVHRDVSPQNILIGSSGVVKIVDFGVAKALGRSGETSAGQLKGKVPFMSPEQAKGGKVDRRTDIFALGIILYRIATQTHPFLDETDIKTMRNIISRPVMPPRVKTPSLPVELERIILKALQKDPDKRFSSAAEMETELDAVIAASYGSVPVDEVGTFVRATLGERDRKRRAAVRDAALKMDQSANIPTIVGAPPSMESVSGVMLTQTHTPVGSQPGAKVPPPATSASSSASIVASLDAPPDAADAASKTDDAETSLQDEVTRAYDVSGARGLDSAAPSPTPPHAREPHDSLLGTSPTLAALASPGSPSVRPAPQRSKAIAIAAAVAAGVGLGIVLVAKLGSQGDGAIGAASANADARRTETTVAGADTASERATATPSSAAVAAETSSSPALDVHDLPEASAAPTGSAGPTAPRGPVQHGGPIAAAPNPSLSAKPTAGTPVSTPPATAAPVSKPPPSTPGVSLPTVQDPGF